MHSALFQEQAGGESEGPLAEIERLYLLFSFDELPSEIEDKAASPVPNDGHIPVVPSLKEKMEQLLLGVANNVLNCYSPDVSSGWI